MFKSPAQIKLFRIYSEQRFSTSHTKEKQTVDIIMLVLAFFSAVIIFYESYEQNYFSVLNIISLVIDIIFAADYILRVYFSGFSVYKKSDGWNYTLSRHNYIQRWYGIVDLISVLPPLLFYVFHFGIAAESYSRLGRLLRLLRFGRVIRVLRSFRLLRETHAIYKLWRDINHKVGKELKLALLFILGVLVLGAIGETIIESANPKFNDYGESFFWSLFSMLGAGDGSLFQTTFGRILGVLLIICGLIFLSVLTSSFTTYFVEKIKMSQTGCQSYNKEGHILICGYNSKLEEIFHNFKYLKNNNDIVLLNNLEPAEFTFQPEIKLKINSVSKVYWIKGSQTNPDDLLRANPVDASQIIILSDSYNMKTLNEGDIDARSLMALMLLREIFENDRKAHPGRDISDYPPITIELSKKESSSIARTHGASSIIYTDEVIGQFITMTLSNINNISIFNRLLDPMDMDADIIDLSDLIKNNMIEAGNNIIENISDSLKKEGRLLIGFQFSSGFLVSIENKEELLDTAIHLHVHKYIEALLKKGNKPGRILKDDNLIILNPWQEYRRNLCKFLLNEYTGRKEHKSGQVYCVLLKEM